MKQSIILMSGFSRSGKTTLAKKISKKFPQIIRIDSDSIHILLNKNFPQLFDGKKVDKLKREHKHRNKLSKKIQLLIMRDFLNQGYSVLFDSCNIRKSIREKIIKEAKEENKKIVSIIVRQRITNKKLQENIAKEAPVWKKLYEKIQKPNFEEPKKNEAEHLLIHENNTKEVLSQIQKIIN